MTGTLITVAHPVLVRHLLNNLAAAGDLVARGQTRARRYYPAGT